MYVVSVYVDPDRAERVSQGVDDLGAFDAREGPCGIVIREQPGSFLVHRGGRIFPRASESIAASRVPFTAAGSADSATAG